jgi:hypothetical protein
MTPDQKKRLEPFANLFAQIGAGVEAMSDEDLLGLLDACYATSKTNCWCCTFYAAQYLPREIHSEMAQRKRRAEALVLAVPFETPSKGK